MNVSRHITKLSCHKVKNKRLKSKKLKRIIKTYNSKIITDNTTYLSQTTYKPIYQYISVLQVKEKCIYDTQIQNYREK